MISQSGNIIDLFSREEQILMAVNTDFNEMPKGIIDMQVANPFGIKDPPGVTGIFFKNHLNKAYVDAIKADANAASAKMKALIEQLKAAPLPPTLDTDE